VILNKIPWFPLLAVLLLGTVAIAIPLGIWNGKMRSQHTYAFPDLQDATTVDQARTILQKWDDSGANEEIAKTMRLDLAFPFFYATLLALICLRASINTRHPWVAVTGIVLAVGAVAGGVFDLFENMSMLAMLGDVEKAGRIGTVRAFGMPKVYLAMLAAVYGWLAHFDA
jgi:hypothetical protein